jgi:hypothetical protein
MEVENTVIDYSDLPGVAGYFCYDYIREKEIIRSKPQPPGTTTTSNL